MREEPLHYLSLRALSVELKGGQRSSVDVTAALLERIDRLNPELGAYYTVFQESALDEAAAADRELREGTHRGPLQGVPVGLKDLYELGRTSAGSGSRLDHTATGSGMVVSRLRDQGAVILGKLATHEFGLSTPNMAELPVPARNPWNPELTPGGSSSGAGVAVAAGLAFGAFGTDSGGSVRLPAAHCSVVGTKPTFGLVGRSGILPLSWSLDHAGLLARSVHDTALLFDAVRGEDPADPGSSALQPALDPAALEAGAAGLKIAVPRDFWQPSCDPQVAAVVEEALCELAGLGAKLREVDLGVSMEEAVATAYLIALSEAAAHHAPQLRVHGHLYGREFRLLMKAALLIPATAYVDAQRARRVIGGRVLHLLETHELLAMPTLGLLADPIPSQPRPIHRRISEHPAPLYTWLANLYGGPAISVPAGFSPDQRPVGLQLMGRPYDDGTVLRAAAGYEAAAAWRRRHPIA